MLRRDMDEGGGTTQWHESVTAPEWDAELYARGGHFLQGSHWFAFQAALGRPTYFARGDGWSCAAYLETGASGARRLYCPYGPQVSAGDGFGAAFSALSRLAAKLDVAQLRMEPLGAVSEQVLRSHGLARMPRDFQPSLTWVKDLTRPADQLLAEMSATNRNLHRTAANKGLSIETSQAPDDVDIFLGMIREVAVRTGMQPHADSYFQAMARTLMPRRAMTLYLALRDGEPVASALSFDSPTTRYYVHAGSYQSARKVHAGSPLLTRMILDAHAAGQQWFDFWGAAPADQPDHRWAGFTRFKQSFGGDYLRYAGSWELTGLGGRT
jgi:hypothetical protein